ncbi:MAG: response regulator transcription factor [Dehalococcoidia bacterium]
METDRAPVLIVDDDEGIREMVQANLEAMGWRTAIARDGIEALETVTRTLPSIVILDIMMPGMDGFEVLSRLRKWSQVPVIMLSVREDRGDKVKCLDLGADDYVTKPFGVDELMARVRAVLRRRGVISSTSEQPASFSSGDLHIDFSAGRVTLAGKDVKLTPREYTLLQELVLNAGRTVPHDYLLSRLWKEQGASAKGLLHVLIRRLRAKLEADPDNPRYIITITGFGYRLEGGDR